MNKINLCLVAPFPPPYGGIANWTRLVLKIAQNRNDITIQLVDISPRWRAIHDLSIWKRTIGGGFQLIRDYFRFLLVLNNRCQIVHIVTAGQFGIVRDILFLKTAKILKIPCIYHIRFGRVVDISKKNTKEWRLLLKAMSLTSAIITLDQFSKEKISNLFPNVTVYKIPNGFDFEIPRNSPSQKSKRNLLYLGWIIPTKGISELAQAWSLLNPKDWRCLVVGPGDPDYQRDLKEKNQLIDFEFRPELDHSEAMKLLDEADAFVLPSYTEGFPNVIIEAMALGKAIIATDVGAVPEMLADECGIVVPPKDVSELSKALGRVIFNQHLRTEIGSRAKEKANSEYSMVKVFDKLLQVWKGNSKNQIQDFENYINT